MGIITKIFNKKMSLAFKIVMIILTALLITMMILSIPSTHGDYIYHAGATKAYDATGAAPEQVTAIKAAFASRAPIIGNLLWGDVSLMKVGLFFAGIAFVGTVFQMTRFFKGEFANLFSSCLIAVSALIAFALSSNAATLSVAIISMLTAGYCITESALVTFKGVVIE